MGENITERTKDCREWRRETIDKGAEVTSRRELWSVEC